MHVLLISANTEQFNMPAMPLGLACVAEATISAGHDVTMLDLMFAADVATTLATVISETRPGCIGISVRNIDDQDIEARTFLLAKVKEIVAVCRDLSSAPIVLGGAGYSIYPGSVLSYLDADFGIKGEGEIAFPALLAHLEDKTDPSGTPGLYSRNHDPHSPPELSSDLDRLQLPEPRILSSSASRSQDPWIPVQTRRGCPLRCSYCSTPAIEGTLLRKRSPEGVAAWLERWVSAGYENFFFVDNTFNLPPDYAKSICRNIIARELAMRWRCIIFPKRVDKELAELMFAAGCRQVSLGFESGSAKMLKHLNKQFTLADIRMSSTLFGDCGIERMGFLLLGGPGETKSSVEESLAFADSLNLEMLRITVGIRIYPSTQLAAIAEKHGIISSEDDLLQPQFYLSPDVAKWLPERLIQWRANRNNVIM